MSLLYAVCRHFLSDVEEKSPPSSSNSQDRPSEDFVKDSASNYDKGMRPADSHVDSRTDTSEDAEGSVLQLNECKSCTRGRLVW